MCRRTRADKVIEQADLCNGTNAKCPTALSKVRSQGQPGRHLLSLSSSQFDPERTLTRTTHCDLAGTHVGRGRNNLARARLSDVGPWLLNVGRMMAYELGLDGSPGRAGVPSCSPGESLRILKAARRLPNRFTIQ
jgi:hypothetical protein